MALANILFNPLNAELNPIRHLLALVGAHHILHVSRVRVKNVSGTRPYNGFLKPHSFILRTLIGMPLLKVPRYLNEDKLSGG